MKTILGVILLAILGWIAWPYYAVYDLIKAAKEGDATTLERRVVWDGVRQGLREDFNAILAKKVAEQSTKPQDQSAILGAGFAAVLGPVIINQMVDAYVTPQAVAAIIREGRGALPDKKLLANSSDPPQPASGNAAAEPDHRVRWDRVKYAFFSGGPTTFKVEVLPESDQSTQSPTTLIFAWNGDWRLARIHLPLDDLSAASK
jgi:hypothetical protein